MYNSINQISREENANDKSVLFQNVMIQNKNYIFCQSMVTLDFNVYWSTKVMLPLAPQQANTVDSDICQPENRKTEFDTWYIRI